MSLCRGLPCLLLHPKDASIFLLMHFFPWFEAALPTSRMTALAIRTFL